MTAASTISPKYQVSIPKALRDKLHWRPGQKLAFIPKGNGVLMIPVPSREELVGIARGAKADDYRDRNDRY
ncbi:MAG: AbrB/MazE/SpoVT family DNA-binding domain-containing protein [Roseiarcus sp.]